MLNIIVVSDDLDALIGSNCTLSHEHLDSQVNLRANNLIILNGNLCTAEQVEKAVASFNGGKFIFVAYSHGREDALLSNEGVTEYLDKNNSYFFSSSFVYTNSCYSGIQLKGSLIDAGCFGYVGYTDEVRLPENEEDDILFIACENSGLIHFLNSGDLLSLSMQVMKSKYREQYNDFLSKNMNVAASFILHNLNALTFYDNGTLTRKALEN